MDVTTTSAATPPAAAGSKSSSSKKHSSSKQKKRVEAETRELEFDVSPGVGGYSVVVFKGDQSIGAAPLNGDSVEFLKRKYKKHQEAALFNRTKAAKAGLQPAQKAIQKKEGVPRRPLTDVQKANLQRGREVRAQKLAAAKAAAAAAAAAATPAASVGK